MPRGSKRAEAKAERARSVLIETIAKISDLEPTLGGKWRRKMVDYYVGRLAELLLYQSGFDNPSKDAIEEVSVGIRSSLSSEPSVD